MMLVRVAGLWVNPAQVVAVYVTHWDFEGTPERWQAHLRCTEDKEWVWSFPVEEDAYLKADRLAEQVNAPIPERDLR